MCTPSAESCFRAPSVAILTPFFAASGETTAWVLLWRPRSRPIGVRVCPVAQLHVFSTASDPQKWTMVVFWKEVSGRRPQLIVPENGGGDETNYPSPPNFTFFDDPDVPIGPCGPPWTSGTSWTAWNFARMASRPIACW